MYNFTCLCYTTLVIPSFKYSSSLRMKSSRVGNLTTKHANGQPAVASTQSDCGFQDVVEPVLTTQQLRILLTQDPPTLGDTAEVLYLLYTVARQYYWGGRKSAQKGKGSADECRLVTELCELHVLLY